MFERSVHKYMGSQHYDMLSCTPMFLFHSCKKYYIGVEAHCGLLRLVWPEVELLEKCF